VGCTYSLCGGPLQVVVVVVVVVLIVIVVAVVGGEREINV
jgi:hypothetical protein